MPSASIFLSNLSLASTTPSVKAAKGAQNVQEIPPEDRNKNFRGPGKTLVLTSIAVVLSSAIPAGYNIGVLNAPQEIIQNFANETVFDRYNIQMTKFEANLLWSVIVSIFLIGGMIGSLLSGWICNKCGRKGAILIISWFGLCSSILFTSSYWAHSVEMLILARLLVGVFSGFSTSALPVYLTEISPQHLRGPLGVLQLLGMNFGLLLSLVLGLRSILGNDDGWPYLLGLFILPISLGTSILIFCPESPKFLFIVKGKSEKALKELSRLRGLPVSEFEDDVIEMKSEVGQQLDSPSWSFLRVISCKEIRKPLLLLCVMHASQQLSGINAVFYYSTGIFNKAGMNYEESQYAGIGAGMANFLMAALSTVMVSRFGRKCLYLTSSAGAVFCLGGLTASFSYIDASPFVPYLAIVFLLTYVVSFGIGLSPIPFFIGSELFQPGPRPIAMSIGCTINWLFNFLVAISFPTIQDFLGQYSFLIFIIITALSWFIILKYLPETKDKDYQEIRAYFGTLKRNDESLKHDAEEKLPLGSSQKISTLV